MTTLHIQNKNLLVGDEICLYGDNYFVVAKVETYKYNEIDVEVTLVDGRSVILCKIRSSLVRRKELRMNDC